MKKYHKGNPPRFGELSVEEWDKEVDHKSFPKCSVCKNPIYNPEFYAEDMCGPCMTGESETIMTSPLP